MTRPPCWDEITDTDCTERTDFCHATCERFREWQKIHDEELARVMRNRQTDIDANVFLGAQGERTSKDALRKRQAKRRRKHHD